MAGILLKGIPKLAKKGWKKKTIKVGTTRHILRKGKDGSIYGTVEGAKDYVPYLKRSSKERAKERAADAALKRKNIERIRKLPESIGGKDIKKFGSGAEKVTRDKKLMKKIFPKGKK